MKPKTKATPAKKPQAQPAQVTAAEHFRLRPPSEKPRKEDADSDDEIIYWDELGSIWRADYKYKLPSNAVAWIPGRLPAHLIPKPPSPEEVMRQEFEKVCAENNWETNTNKKGEYVYGAAYTGWIAWQAAKREVKP